MSMFPGILKAALEIAYDNGGEDAERTELMRNSPRGAEQLLNTIFGEGVL